MKAREGVRKLTMEELGRKSPESFAGTEKLPLVVVLDNIRSGHNVGAIFRSADSFLVREIIVCGITPLPTQREVLKSALGSTHTVPWRYAEETSLIINELRSSGWQITAVEQTTGSRRLGEAAGVPERPVVLVFGNEVQGISDPVLSQCDDFLEIPQAGTKHSLNVAVCAGIVMFEYYRLLSGRDVG